MLPVYYMARKLTLVRHAKSSWDNADLRDFDRPLNRRGFKHASAMGNRLANNNYSVDVIISSPAVRAIITAELIAGEIGFDKNNILCKPEIYAAGLHTLLNVITNIDDKHEHAMLVGHNPGCTCLYNYLCDACVDNVPTCSVVQIAFNTHTWQGTSEHSGKIIDFDFPKKTNK